MTYFEDDSGNVIEISDDFSLTKSAVDLFNFSIKGNSSVTFKVLNNSSFKKAFNYWSPLQNPSNGFSSPYFNLVKNGNILSRGKLILEREDDDYLYFFFLGGNSNWINLIQDKLKELDYEEYKMTWTCDSIVTLKSATDGFCFPLVDWAYQFKKHRSGFYDYAYLSTAISDGSGNIYNDFYPCFFLKSAIAHIFKIHQLKIGGDILNDPVYQQMIITPDDGEIKRAPKFLKARQTQVKTSADFSVTTSNITIAPLDTIVYDGELLSYDSISQVYNVHKDFYLQTDILLTLSSAFPITVYMNKNGFAVASVNNIDGQGTPVFDIKLIRNAIGKGASGNLEYAFSDGDQIWFSARVGKRDRGNWDASGGLFPTSSVIKGDAYTINVAGTLCGTAVSSGYIIVALVSTPGQTCANWFVSTSAVFKIKSESLFTISPRELMNDFSFIQTDTIRASDILPDIDCIDLIKFVANYFCCIIYFDESTGTVNFNKLDNFRLEDYVDWSQYLQKKEINYSIKTALNNYIRFQYPDDPIMRTLNVADSKGATELNYGEINLNGLSQTKINNDLFKIPFGAAIDRQSNGYSLPYIGLIELEDGDPVPITSITSKSIGGFAFAQFNNSNNLFNSLGTIVRIEGTQALDGYYTIVQGDTSYFYSSELPGTPNPNFVSASSARVYPQIMSYKSEQSRILFFVPNYTLPSSLELITVLPFDINGQRAITTVTDIGAAYFSKPTTGQSISSYRQGLNVGPISFSGYKDVPRSLDNFKILQRILQSPYVKLWLNLPEFEYAKFKFDKFIFIQSEDQQYFLLIDDIENYKDSKTLCQVYCYLVK